MYISGNKPVHRISQLYQDQSRVNRKQQNQAMKSDKVTLSNESKELNAIFQQVYAQEETSGKTLEIKERVDSGTYKVSSEDIAASILEYLKQQV